MTLFLLFRDISHIDKFLNYINSQHPSIQFMSKIETNSMLNFLDITVSKIDDTFKTSVFRKKTFTGLGRKFDSFVPHQFKTNLISCLIKRAFKICSEETAFNAELSYHIKTTFQPTLSQKCSRKCYITFIIQNL